MSLVQFSFLKHNEFSFYVFSLFISLSQEHFQLIKVIGVGKTEIFEEVISLKSGLQVPPIEKVGIK